MSTLELRLQASLKGCDDNLYLQNRCGENVIGFFIKGGRTTKKGFKCLNCQLSNKTSHIHVEVIQ